MVFQDQYQQRASECIRLAEASVDEKGRKTGGALALWRLRLSEHAEAFRRKAACPSGGPVDEPIGRISQARGGLPAHGQVHARSRQQGDMEPDGRAMAALR